MKYKVQDRDQIANLMLLTHDENRTGAKGDKLPEEWFADKDREYFELHLIPMDRNLLKLENYEGFIAARKELILEKFHDVIVRT